MFSTFGNGEVSFYEVFWRSFSPNIVPVHDRSLEERARIPGMDRVLLISVLEPYMLNEYLGNKGSGALQQNGDPVGYRTKSVLEDVLRGAIIMACERATCLLHIYFL